MTKEVASKSLKDQNRWQLWLTIAVNTVIFYSMAQSDTLAILGFKGLVTAASNLLPVGFAIIITTVANGLMSAEMKGRLVFCRWNYALPGHRAFSKYAVLDNRIDVERLEKALNDKLPSSPEDQNRVWYRFMKEVEKDPAVQQVHRDFLFTRDYTSFAVLFLFIFGIASQMIVQSWRVAIVYDIFLVLQFVVVRQAAATYGMRFVCTVLALKSAQQTQITSST